MAYSSNLYMVTSKEGYEAIYHLVRDLNQLTKLMKYKGNEFVFMEVPHVAEELTEEIIEIMNENTDSIPCSIRMTIDSQFGFHADESHDFDNKIEDVILPKLIEYESKEECDYDNDGFDEEYYDDNSRIAFRVPKNCKVVYDNFNEMV